MDAKYSKDLEVLIAWAKEEARIQALLVIGSQARVSPPHSEWSDLDILMLVENPDYFIEKTDWLERFGRVVVVAEEIVDLGFVDLTWYVKRPLYSDSRAIDFSIMPFDRIDDVLSINREIHAKGYEVVYDANGDLVDQKVRASLQAVVDSTLPAVSEAKLRAVTSDLLYHVIWAFKKALANELWVAVACVNCYMRGSLLQLIEFHNATISQQTNPIAYEGRFLENRTARSVLDQLENCFTKYNLADLIETLHSLLDLTQSMSVDICRTCGYEFDDDQFQTIRQMYSAMKEACNESAK